MLILHANKETANLTIPNTNVSYQPAVRLLSFLALSMETRSAASLSPPRPERSTTCRHCGRTFGKYRELIGHVFSAHPKSREPDTSAKATGPTPPKKRVSPAPRVPETQSNGAASILSRPQFELHPFPTLSYQDQLTWAFYTIYALFVIGMKQLEQEQQQQHEQQQQQGQPEEHEQQEHAEQASSPSSISSANPPLNQTLGSQLDTVHATVRWPDQNHHEMSAEDSDPDSDGGVTLSDPELGTLR